VHAPSTTIDRRTPDLRIEDIIPIYAREPPDRSAVRRYSMSFG
jgi:hypothetical protein